MIKILIGGSPCTFWSIAQKNNRELTAEGQGWELFKNYLIAKEKFKPDIFLYENNKSAAQAIKDQIKKELKVDNVNTHYIEINSALVSAQNRQRFYVHNCGFVGQPTDRNIILKDILQCTTTEIGYEIENIKRLPDYGKQDKSRPITAHYSNNCGGWFDRINDPNPAKQQVDMIAEPINLCENKKSHTIKAQYYKNGIANFITNKGYDATAVAEPVIMQRPHGFNKGGVKKSKTPTLTANGSYQENNLVVEPIRVGDIGSNSQAHRVYSCNGKSTTINAGGGGQGGKTGLYTCPIKVGEVENGGQGNRIYSCEGKAVSQTAQGGGLGSNTGLYSIPIENVGNSKTIQKALPKLVKKYGYIPEQFNAYNVAEIKEKSPTLSTGSMVTSSCATTKFEKSNQPIYEVKNGLIEIKGKTYPIKLDDGFYIIRKLTPIECERLQTMPDNYTEGVSNAQRYKALGNGWTAEVVKHILQNALKDIPKDEDIIVLSMYDGIATGRYILDSLGFTNITYYAYEIDKYAIQIAQKNYPDIIQCGDAFLVRNEDWKLTAKKLEDK